jgi:hypothetical protein
MIEGEKGHRQLSRLMMNQGKTNCNTYTLKKSERSDSTLRHSIFDILRFCGSLLNLNPEPCTLERIRPNSDRLCSCSGPALLPARAGRSDWKK